MWLQQTCFTTNVAVGDGDVNDGDEASIDPLVNEYYWLLLSCVVCIGLNGFFPLHCVFVVVVAVVEQVLLNRTKERLRKGKQQAIARGERIHKLKLGWLDQTNLNFGGPHKLLS
jgi:hypothetical protein